MSKRSYHQITKDHLLRLRKIALDDLADFFQRTPETGDLYSNRLFAVALCQGAALHYVDGKRGVKDFDVWSFFKPHPERQFPFRRYKKQDFGDPLFGTAEDSPGFVGRRVDLFGRSIPDEDYSDPVAVLRRYLLGRQTESARYLAQKAVVLLEPLHLLGTVVWPE